jgi:RimJ/RimL family protein N-acetyltransferase
VRHELHVSGHGYDLRPAELADSEEILALRSDAHQGRFIQRGATTVDEQREWMLRYLDRDGDYLFMVERKNGRVEGLVGVYDVAGKQAEWGRWVLRPGSMAALESALGAYRVGFDLLHLQRMYCRTVANNIQVASFHDSCGLRRTGHHLAPVEIDGRSLPMIEHELTRDEWSSVHNRLAGQAGRIASRLR